MKTTAGHLTYCTNIHPGESWSDHFSALKQYIPKIKSKLVPHQKFGIGLRLSNLSSEQLQKPENLTEFKNWLSEENCYVFTMNGFPYGNFHRQRVKDQVHQPDWTTRERVEYTKRLFLILSDLIPEGTDGGVSTSPLSYKPWFDEQQEREKITKTATDNILKILELLVHLRKTKKKVLHLDIEPEPDGLLENSSEFVNWYKNDLIPAGIPFLQDKFGVPRKIALDLIRSHICLCYDVCHFSIGYENAPDVLNKIAKEKIRIGKVQLSAAIKAYLNHDSKQRLSVADALRPFDEETYLHQVIAKRDDGSLYHYPDLPDALKHITDNSVTEWRSHFHVPLFIDHYGILESTKDAVMEIMNLQLSQPFTNHLEVETYTWEVLPRDLQVDLEQSIIRELQWVTELMPLSYPD